MVDLHIESQKGRQWTSKNNGHCFTPAFHISWKSPLAKSNPGKGIQGTVAPSLTKLAWNNLAQPAMENSFWMKKFLAWIGEEAEFMESSWRRCSVHWGSKEEYDLDMGKREWANTSCLNTSFILVSAQSMYHFHGTWTRNHRTLEVGCGLETDRGRASS